MKGYNQRTLMYYKIHELRAERHSISSISQTLELNWRTVKAYLAMDADQYQSFLLKNKQRSKQLQAYGSFIESKLSRFPETPAAQMHDWLLEHYPDFPAVTARTVFNFVNYIRQTKGIPKQRAFREYSPVEELPFGKQAQVDFGQYSLLGDNNQRVKVYFFVMVLSRSRYKFVCFSKTHFTARTAIVAHLLAFQFFGGMPHQIVYDQDRVFMVDENMGHLLLTTEFTQFVQQQKFLLHFCKKADPESKGKVENVVKYVKQNFLFNRGYINIDLLNQQALEWLGRTANEMPHNTTKIAPKTLWEQEKRHLNPIAPFDMEHTAGIQYTVRKTNEISYKGNFYSLPCGTYKGPDTKVFLKEDPQNQIIVLSDKAGKELAKHPIWHGKGKNITNTDHKRDKNKKILQLKQDLLTIFDNELAEGLLSAIHKTYPRYARDQFQYLLNHIGKYNKEVRDNALQYCTQNNLICPKELIGQCQTILKDNAPVMAVSYMKPFHAHIDLSAMDPAKSNIETYAKLFINGKSKTTQQLLQAIEAGRTT